MIFYKPREKYSTFGGFCMHESLRCSSLCSAVQSKKNESCYGSADETAVRC